MNRNQLLLYGITDRRLLANGESLTEAVERAVRGGATIIQLREKTADKSEILRIACELRDICHKYDALFIVNDSVSLAYESKADGVHLGIDDDDVGYARNILGENAVIGATAHNLSEARTAWKAGADYLGCGAVFGSKTKTDTIPLSIETLTEICRSSPVPVVAIGGINAENALLLKGSGIAGIAVVSALFAEKDIEASAAVLKKLAAEAIGKD